MGKPAPEYTIPYHNNKFIFNVPMLASTVEHQLSKSIGEERGSDNQKFR
jgi:hypothetical protein